MLFSMDASTPLATRSAPVMLCSISIAVSPSTISEGAPGWSGVPSAASVMPGTSVQWLSRSVSRSPLTRSAPPAITSPSSVTLDPASPLIASSPSSSSSGRAPSAARSVICAPSPAWIVAEVGQS